MGTERLAKAMLGGALALLLCAPAWASELNYVESDEGNPELPASATPSAGDLELPLLPIEPEAEPAPAEPSPEEAAPPAEEAPVEVEIPALPETEVAEEPATAAESTYDAGAQARLSAAGTMLYNGDTEGAIAAFERLVNTPGLDSAIHAGAVGGYASALRAAGRRDEAEHWFQEALDYDPDNAGLRLAFAYTLAENEKLDPALQQLKLAEQLEPGSQQITLARARAYAWNGNYDEALQYYNNITDHALAEDAQIGLAYVQYWLGRRDEAAGTLANVQRDDEDTRTLGNLLAESGGQHEGHYVQHVGTHEASDGSFAVSHRNASINSDNTYEGNTATLSVPLGPEGSRIFLSYEDFDLDNGATPALTASGTNTRVGFDARLDDHTKVTGYAGKVSIDNSGGQAIDHTDIGLRLAGQFEDWNYHAAYADNLLYDTPALSAIDDGRTSLELGVGFKVLDDDTTLNLMYGSSEYGVAKLNGYDIDLRKTMCYDCRGQLAYGLHYRTQTNTGAAVAGYFAPDDYQLGEVYLDWVDYSDNDVKLDASVGVGMQAIAGGDWESTLRAAVGVRYNVSDNFMLRAGVSSSNLPGVADDASGDFSREEWYVSGDWKF